MKPHWYKVTVYECPVCGGGKDDRQRMYTPKPVDPAERYEYVQSYDWCMEGGWG